MTHDDQLPTGARSIACPKCGAQPGKACRTTSGTNRTTDTHVARWEARYPRLALRQPNTQESTTP